jgi:hypothetical protein
MMDNTLHDLIAQLGELRAEKKRLDYAARKVTEHITAKEREIIDVMDDQHITETKSEAGKVTLGEAVYPQVEDWDAVYDFILENRFLHCLEKRFAVLAYREILEQGNVVPGVVPFTKRKITFRET